MDQLFQSVQHGSTDERLLSTVVQEDRAFYHFSVDMEEAKHKKPELVTKLSECMINDPEKLPLPV